MNIEGVRGLKEVLRRAGFSVGPAQCKMDPRGTRVGPRLMMACDPTKNFPLESRPSLASSRTRVDPRGPRPHNWAHRFLMNAVRMHVAKKGSRSYESYTQPPFKSVSSFR